MLRLHVLLPLVGGVLLLAGCPESGPTVNRVEAARLTSEAQQALRQGKFDEALVSIDAAIAIEATGDRYRIRAETHMDDLPAALADINKGLEIEPNNKRLLNWKKSFEEAMQQQKKKP